MSLRRPPAPKIRTAIPRPRRSPRKLSTSIRSTRLRKKHHISKTSKSKKKKPLKLGTCYSKIGCQGDILLFRVTKARCKAIGGRSWKGPKGCESIPGKKKRLNKK